MDDLLGPLAPLFRTATVLVAPDAVGNVIRTKEENSRLKRVSMPRGRLWLGMCAGTKEPKLSNLLHEMAHFIEIDDRRCGMYGWGLKLPRIVGTSRYGINYDSFKTDQHIRREIRVCAVQLNLAQHFAISDKELGLEYLANTLTLLPDTHTFCLRDKRPLQIKLAESLVKAQKLARFSADAALREWERKNEVLRRRYRRSGIL